MFNKQIINSIKTDYRGKFHGAPEKEKAKKINIKPTNFLQEAAGSKEDRKSKKGASNKVVNQWLLNSEQEEGFKLPEDDTQSPKADVNLVEKSEIGILNDATLQAMNAENTSLANQTEEPNKPEESRPEVDKSENLVAEDQSSLGEPWKKDEERDRDYKDNYRGGYNKSGNTKGNYYQSGGSKYEHYESKATRGKKRDDEYDDYYNEEPISESKDYDLKSKKYGGSNNYNSKYYKKEDSENTGYSEKKHYKKTEGQRHYGKQPYQKEVVIYVVKDSGSQ